MFVTVILALVFGNSLKKTFTTASHGFSFLSTTLTVLGFILLAFYALSLITKKLKWITLSTLPVTLAIIAVAIFALGVSSKGSGHSVAGRSFKEYHLDSYSKWMQHKVNDSSDWQTYYRKDLSSNNVCSDLTDVHKADDSQQFYQIKLSSLQSGCCKPLEGCNFTFVSPTNWTKITNTSTISDCNTWNNDPAALCFNCDSCKASFIQDVKSHWFLAAIVILLVAVAEVAIYVALTFMCRDS